MHDTVAGRAPGPLTPGPRRETHLTRNRLQMRLPISTHPRNPLKHRILQRLQLQLHIPVQMRRPLVTHLPQKRLQMRHKISTNLHNQLKNRHLILHD